MGIPTWKEKTSNQKKTFFMLVASQYLILLVITGNIFAKRMVEEEETFPKTLQEFGFRFNEEGKLRSIETDEPYEFEVRKGPGQHSYNQKRYNALRDVVTEHIYQLMEKEYKLQRTYIPADAEANEPKTFVFMSGDLFTNDDKLLLLIHGSGAVRAGQWLIINEDLDQGSQLPYIKWGRENGYAVLVANTNVNSVEATSKNKKKKDPVKIRGSSTPEEHVETLWHEFVQKARAKHVAIVAHSYGGICTLQMAMKHIREFENRVFAIALTDSVHSYKQQKDTPEVRDLYLERAMNWASAYDPLDAPLQTEPGECPTVSAGTERHEYTSYSAMQSIFTWLTEKYDKKIPSRMRVSMGEPQNAHYHRPSSSEVQHLVSRSDGVGAEEPVKQSANKIPSAGEGDGSEENLISFDEDGALKSDDAAKSKERTEETEEQSKVPTESDETKNTVKQKSEL